MSKIRKIDSKESCNCKQLVNIMNTTKETFFLDTPKAIRRFHILSQISAIKLEGKGIRFKGGSILSHCKKVYSIKGSRESIIKQMESLANK